MQSPWRTYDDCNGQLHACTILLLTPGRKILGDLPTLLVSLLPPFLPRIWTTELRIGLYNFFLFFLFFFFFLIQYNKYNTIIEHISTPVATVDNIHIQIYMHMLYIHNRQKDTSIQTKSWTKYFIDRYLPAQWVIDCLSHVLMSLICSLGSEDIKQKDRTESRKEQQQLWGRDKSS